LQNEQPLTDEDFLAFLHEGDLRREYSEAARGIDARLVQEFDEPAAHQFKYKDKDEEISVKDKYHRETLNACIYPFSQKGSLKELGYYFIRSEPLLELRVENLDFLIASSEKGIAIFGEAKTSTADPAGLIAEMNVRKRIIEQNKAYLNEALIPNIENFEYVFGLPAIEARYLSSAILKNDALNYIIWEYGGPESNQILSLYVPPGEKWEGLRRIRHADNQLNSRLVRVPTSKKFKNFFLQSHPVAKIAILTWIDIGKEEEAAKGQFSRQDVKNICSIELEYYCKDIIDREVDRIIKSALEIGFVKKLEETGETYKITTSSTDPAARYEDLKTRWIEHSIEHDKTERVNEERMNLQLKFRIEKERRYPPLVPFEDEERE
jgi:hypothetical protein